MLRDHGGRRLREPLLDGEVLKLRRAENLEHLDRLVADVLDKVGVVLGYDADVTGLVVEGAGVAVGGEDGDARLAAEEEGPLVGVGVPVHFAQAVRVDRDVGGGGRLGDREIGRVGDAHFATGELERLLLEHAVRKAVLGRDDALLVFS